jgi:hypothetical protein
MANGTPTPQSPPNPLDGINGKLDILATRIGEIETALGELKTKVSNVNTSADKPKKDSIRNVLIGAGIAAAASITVSLIAANATMRAARKSFDATMTAAQKNFETASAAARIAANATLSAAQMNFVSALAIAQKNLDNAAKNAFESGRGKNASAEYDIGRNLIVKIKHEFAESGVQGSAKVGLRKDDLVALKTLADKLGVQSLIDLSDYAGQLYAAYQTKTKRWEDYGKQEEPKMEKLADKALQDLNRWTSDPQ